MGSPEFKPKAPKPKVDTPKMPKITLGTEGQDVRNLKNKPKALANAESKKKKSDAKTLAKLPSAKKNLGEGDVYEVKGKPKAKGKLKKGSKEYKKLLAELTDIDLGPDDKLSKVKIAGSTPKAEPPKKVTTKPKAKAKPVKVASTFAPTNAPLPKKRKFRKI